MPTKPKLFPILAAISLLTSAAVFVYLAKAPAPTPDRWDQAAQDETARLAEPLIAAIEAFKADHQYFPPSLDRLTPDYLPEIPQPTLGSQSWSYMTKDDRYSISVHPTQDNLPSTPTLIVSGPGDFSTNIFIYNPTTQQWRIDD